MSSFFATESLSVGYQGKALIGDINLSLGRGEIMTLIGPNGSGKSTILKSISRHLASIAGVVSIDRQDLRTMDKQEMARRLSVVLTDRVSPEMMTCGDVVEEGRYPYTSYFGSLTAEDRAIVEDSLRKVRALDLKDRDFSAISDGQRQRIMLARAICQQPEIIVLDEPTSFLDIRHKIELLDILREMAKEQQITVIMSLHEIDLAAKISDQIVCVKGERIARVGPPEAVFSEGVICELYDLHGGDYNILFGSVELTPPGGEPRLFVLAGDGKGIPFYRQLQKRGLPFVTGLLHDNDIDVQVANALATRVFSAAAFQPIDQGTIEAALIALRSCRALLHTGVTIGEFNAANRRLLDEAERLGIAIVADIEALPAL